MPSLLHELRVQFNTQNSCNLATQCIKNEERLLCFHLIENGNENDIQHIYLQGVLGSSLPFLALGCKNLPDLSLRDIEHKMNEMKQRNQIRS